MVPMRGRKTMGLPLNLGFPHEITLRRGQTGGLVDTIAERVLQF